MLDRLHPLGAVTAVVASARLLTLGRLALLDGEGRDLLPPEYTKLLGLLGFLTAAPGRRATREQLMDLFWDDRSVELARGSLRQALHRLRDTLGEQYLPQRPGDVIVTPALVCDRDEFLAAVAAGSLDDAIDRYGGAFIPGFLSRGGAHFEQWRDQERERLSHLFDAAAESVAQRALDAGNPKRASAIAARRLAYQPLNERAWRLRLQAEVAAGNRVHVIASVAELRRLLAAEKLQPETRTLQLLQSLERPLEATAADQDSMELMTDLVGRGPILTKLHDAWREATRRHGVHVHLTGGTGLGKTRVMDDFGARLQAERIRVARARTLPRQRFVSGAMLASLISALVELPGATGISEHSARVLLGLQPALSNRFPAAVPVDFTQLDTRFLARLEALDDLIGAVCHDGPVCLLLDDVHWWDGTSRRTIEHVIERLEGRPVLVVTASRPGPGEVTTANTREKIFLAPLLRDDVVSLLQSLGEHPDAADVERLADGLLRAARGVPLLVLQAIRLGIDRELLALADQRWDLERLDEFLAILHPGRLLNERLALLTPAQRQLLLVAWLAEFPLSGDDAATMEGGADTGSLMELERQGFLTSTQAGLVISHDAIGEAVEAAATADALRGAHRAAGVLTRQRGDDAALLRQAAKQFFDADAKSELVETASVWLRQRRAEGSTTPAAEMISDLLGPSVDTVAVAALVGGLPRDLKRRPWTTRRLAPMWTMVGAVVMAGGWWVSTRQPPPDVVLGVLERDAKGHVSESRIALRQGSWAMSDFKLVAVPRAGLSEWGAGFDSLYTYPIKDPMRDRWVSVRLYRNPSDPNGPTDLALRESGHFRPLAASPGDDASPSWSPDGRFIVFSTTRWSPKADANFDLGILDVATGGLRQLTAGPDGDMVPFWSPDGTRIAFIHRPEQLAPDSLCWITIDGLRRKCRGVPGGQVNGLSGWIDNHSVIVTAIHPDGNRVEFEDVDGGPDRPSDVPANLAVSLSPDRLWLATLELQYQGIQAGTLLTVRQLATPSIRRTILFSGRSPELYWEVAPADRGLAALSVLRSRDTITTGGKSPFRLTVQGSGASGVLLPVLSSVVTWASSNPTVATVDEMGDVRGLAGGITTITASAGGWRQASFPLLVRPEQSRLMLDEQWQQDLPGAWISWGSPRPRLVRRSDGSNALSSNGDGEYSSGLVSKRSFDARNGVALDVEVSTPITRSKWQFVQLWIDLPALPVFSGPGGGAGCSLIYPAGEGWLAHTLIMGIPADSSLATGKWYRLRVQLFPDGSCGYAVNGRAIRHTPDVAVVSDSMDVALGGETVGSNLLFGRVRVWTGVPGDVDWSVVGRKGGGGRN